MNLKNSLGSLLTDLYRHLLIVLKLPNSFRASLRLSVFTVIPTLPVQALH